MLAGRSSTRNGAGRAPSFGVARVARSCFEGVPRRWVQYGTARSRCRRPCSAVSVVQRPSPARPGSSPNRSVRGGYGGRHRRWALVPEISPDPPEGSGAHSESRSGRLRSSRRRPRRGDRPDDPACSRSAARTRRRKLRGTPPHLPAEVLHLVFRGPASSYDAALQLQEDRLTPVDLVEAGLGRAEQAVRQLEWDEDTGVEHGAPRSAPLSARRHPEATGPYRGRALRSVV